MKTTFTDLWYGNICELEACGNNNNILKKETRAFELLETLAKDLSPEQKNVLEKYSEAMLDVQSDYAEAAFAHGLSLGIRLACEAWTRYPR